MNYFAHKTVLVCVFCFFKNVPARNLVNDLSVYADSLQNRAQIENTFADVSYPDDGIKGSYSLHNNDEYTTICWIKKTKIHFFANGTYHGYVEYSISMELAPEPQGNDEENQDTEPFEIYEIGSEKPQRLEFVTVKSSDYEVVKENKTFTCKSDKAYVKTFVSLMQKKRIEIKLKSNLKEVKVDNVVMSYPTIASRVLAEGPKEPTVEYVQSTTETVGKRMEVEDSHVNFGEEHNKKLVTFITPRDFTGSYSGELGVATESNSDALDKIEPATEGSISGRLLPEISPVSSETSVKKDLDLRSESKSDETTGVQIQIDLNANEDSKEGDAGKSLDSGDGVETTTDEEAEDVFAFLNSLHNNEGSLENPMDVDKTASVDNEKNEEEVTLHATISGNNSAALIDEATTKGDEDKEIIFKASGKPSDKSKSGDEASSLVHVLAQSGAADDNTLVDYTPASDEQGAKRMEAVGGDEQTLRIVNRPADNSGKAKFRADEDKTKSDLGSDLVSVTKSDPNQQPAEQYTGEKQDEDTKCSASGDVLIKLKLEISDGVDQLDNIERMFFLDLKNPYQRPEGVEREIVTVLREDFKYVIDKQRSCQSVPKSPALPQLLRSLDSSEEEVEYQFPPQVNQYPFYPNGEINRGYYVNPEGGYFVAPAYPPQVPQPSLATRLKSNLESLFQNTYNRFKYRNL